VGGCEAIVCQWATDRRPAVRLSKLETRHGSPSPASSPTANAPGSARGVTFLNLGERNRPYQHHLPDPRLDRHCHAARDSPALVIAAPLNAPTTSPTSSPNSSSDSSSPWAPRHETSA